MFATIKKSIEGVNPHYFPFGTDLEIERTLPEINSPGTPF